MKLPKTKQHVFHDIIHLSAIFVFVFVSVNHVTSLSALVDGGRYVGPGRVNERDEADEPQSSHREVSVRHPGVRPGVEGVIDRVVFDVLVAETEHALAQSTQSLVGRLKPVPSATRPAECSINYTAS